MTDLPRGWEWWTVGEVADVQLGRQRSPQHHQGPTMRPYLRAANVTWSGVNLEDVKEMNFSPEEARIFTLEPGDILLNEASGSPNEVDAAEGQLRVAAGRLGYELLSKQRGSGVRLGILAAAFSGRLVPQDPCDEPAAVLLERIRRERAAVPRGRRGRGGG